MEKNKNYLTLEEFEKELLKDDDDFKIVYKSSQMVADIIYFLSNFRKKNGISQEQLSSKIGISQKVISNIERLKVSPNLDTVCKMKVGLEILVQEKTKEEHSYEYNLIISDLENFETKGEFSYDARNTKFA